MKAFAPVLLAPALALAAMAGTVGMFPSTGGRAPEVVQAAQAMPIPVPFNHGGLNYYR